MALVALGEKYQIPMTWAICGKIAEDDGRAYDRILNLSARHEIGVHTHSHINASRCNAQELEDEIERCMAALRLDSRPSIFIFPRNREAHFDVVQRLGFITYSCAKRAIGDPKKMNGLWNIPPVYYVDEKSFGARSLIKRYIDICVRQFCLPSLASSLRHRLDELLVPTHWGHPRPDLCPSQGDERERDTRDLHHWPVGKAPKGLTGGELGK